MVIHFFGSCIILKKYYKKQIKDVVLSIFFQLIVAILGMVAWAAVTDLLLEGEVHGIKFSSYGSIIGIIIMIFVQWIFTRKNLKEYLGTALIIYPLDYAISKVACFVFGCCYGIPYNGFGAITYNYVSKEIIGKPLFPVQLLEVILNILIFIYLIYCINKKQKTVYIIVKSMIIYNLCKFLTDFLRSSHIGIIISFTQLTSIWGIVIGCLILYCYKSKKVKSKNEEERINII